MESEAETTDGDSESTDADDEDDDAQSVATEAGGSTKSPEKPVGRSSGRVSAAKQVPTSRANEVDSLFNLTKGGRQTRTSMRAKMLEFMVWDESPSATDSDRAAQDDDTGSKRSSSRRGQNAAAAAVESNKQQVEPEDNAKDIVSKDCGVTTAKSDSKTEIEQQNEELLVPKKPDVDDHNAIKAEVIKSEAAPSTNGLAVKEDPADVAADEGLTFGVSDSDAVKVEVKGESSSEPSDGANTAGVTPSPAPVVLVPLPDVVRMRIEPASVGALK